ncbi:glycosyltransferase family 1 protein [Paenibacillus campi]|uniref:glycosyltransferase family 4 protein n=1 Tax=Paenibacillus campi TaxID=3106031 RepID=UPI002AFE3F09|nr:glycosyltransferase family 1 protein [Paenibacillus sp. SGZ-1009]
MKIAIITETFLPSTDGIVTRLTAVIRWLRRQGHDVLIIAPEAGLREFEGAVIAGIPAYRFFLYRSKKLALPLPRIARLLTQFEPDLVHVVNPAVLGAAGILFGKKWPLIASYHTHIPHYADHYRVGWLKPLVWSYLRLLHNVAQLNLCTSDTVLHELQSQRFRNVKLWQRGVDTERFHPNFRSKAMRERLSGGKPDDILLLYVGRLASEKQIDRIRAVLDSSDRLRLAIVGDGPHRTALERHFAGTRTVFTGFLHGDELSAAYASSDMFIFPSTTETLGLVLLEAMAAGLPIVAAQSGPTLEQVQHGITGMLYDPADPQSLRNHVLALINEQRRQTIGTAARQSALQLGWDGASQQLLSFYEALLQEAGTASVTRSKPSSDSV